MNAVLQPDASSGAPLTFEAHPDSYAHWTLKVEGRTATLSLAVNEDRGLRPGYKLKLNSYDLGVDIELHDALNRVRFEHPTVQVVVLTSGRERMFCSGANIYMLGLSSHAWKVNFCKFTNETRNGIEDSSADGLKFLAACNGTVAGGGYELALACDEILMVDDRSSTVSLPEVPLLGVLPGTGGLTRLTDKRRVRRDLADFFCTTSEGVRAERAKQWKLVDQIAKPQAFAQAITERTAALAAQSSRPADARGVTLNPVGRRIDAQGYHYEHVDVAIDRKARVATITVSAPRSAPPSTMEGITAQGTAWWPLAMARELDDAILMLRGNDLEVGTWVWKTRGDAGHVLAADTSLAANADHWFVRETIGFMRRSFARIDVSSRTLFAILDPESCFAGTLAEFALGADRSYMLAEPEDGAVPVMTLSGANFGLLPTVSGQTRIAARFCGEDAPVQAAKARIGEALDAATASELGLVSFTPDELDWDDEVRIAIEERASLSPDALTGMEASLRFTGPETMNTRIFARLSAWQNWIFIRPNATGDKGALKVYGTGAKASFNWDRI
jgi:benzoyl-CoA-dihydrodiol lyase